MSNQFASVKSFFFDRKEITQKLDPETRKALSKFGAFVRRTSKSSLKYGDKPSPVGKPPTVHRSQGFTRKKKVKGQVVQQPSSPMRELIFFSYDPTTRSVVVGPTLGGSKSSAPEMQEHGGTNVIAVDGVRKIAHYRPRPFMRPAFDKELAKVEGYFMNILK